MHHDDKYFVPFCEELTPPHDASSLELVPFQIGYRCVRLLDGTYEFITEMMPVQAISH